jgi:hypothetical protein
MTPPSLLAAAATSAGQRTSEPGLLAAWRVVSSGTKMQVYPVTLHLHLVDLSFAVLLAACLEREHLCVSR